MRSRGSQSKEAVSIPLSTWGKHMSTLDRLSSKEVAAVRILAFSMVRELKRQGYDPRHIVTLASELIGLACESIRANRKEVPSS